MRARMTTMIRYIIVHHHYHRVQIQCKATTCEHGQAPTATSPIPPRFIRFRRAPARVCVTASPTLLPWDGSLPILPCAPTHHRSTAAQQPRHAEIPPGLLTSVPRGAQTHHAARSRSPPAHPPPPRSRHTAKSRATCSIQASSPGLTSRTMEARVPTHSTMHGELATRTELPRDNMYRHKSPIHTIVVGAQLLVGEALGTPSLG